MSKVIAGKEIVTSDIVTLQSSSHIEDHTFPLVLLRDATRSFACVNLQIPSITGFCIAGCPNFYAVLPWLTGYVLPEGAFSSERDKTFIHCHLWPWVEHQWKELRPSLPHIPDGGKLVRSCSGISVVKSEDS